MVDHYGWNCCLRGVATVMCIVDIEGGALSVAFVEEADGDFFLMTLFSGREHRTHLKKRRDLPDIKIKLVRFAHGLSRRQVTKSLIK